MPANLRLLGHSALGNTLETKHSHWAVPSNDHRIRVRKNDAKTQVVKTIFPKWRPEASRSKAAGNSLNG